MNLAAVAALAAVLGLAAGWLVLADATSPDGGAPRIDDEGPTGRSAFAAALSAERPTRLAVASLAALPADAGPGDVLFLFGTERPVNDQEARAVAAFAVAGGTVVLGLDGGHSQDWATRFGLSYRGLPVVSMAGGPCVAVTLNLSRPIAMCLPSPVGFANVSLADASPPELVQGLFLDLDGDGRLGLGDQGPAAYPLALRIPHGSGQVVALADDDQWSNAALARHPVNGQALALLAGLAGPAGTVYIDATGAERTAAEQAWAPLAHAVLSPSPQQVAAAGGAAACLLLWIAVAPRTRRWQPHSPSRDAYDRALDERAAKMVSKSLRPPQRPDPQRPR